MCCAHPVYSVFFQCVYLCRNVRGIVMLCAEVSLHNGVGWGDVGRREGGRQCTCEVPVWKSG